MENILVIGHSRCGGIQALMGMEEVDSRFLLITSLITLLEEKKHFLIVIFAILNFPVSRSFIHNWVIVGKKAKESTKAVASNLHFDHQCQHCEKVMFFFVVKQCSLYVSSVDWMN